MKLFRADLSKENSLIPMFEHLGYKRVNVPRRVGFDRIKIGLSVKSIDWDMLYNRSQVEKNFKHKSVSVNETVKGEQALNICNGLDPLPWVSSIRVTINSSVLTIRKCNIPSRNDICNFEIYIKPFQGHEILGNLSNNSCEEEQSYVKELMQVVAKEYGIHFEEGYSVLREVEINVTMKINRKEDGLIGPVEILGPVLTMLENFTSSRYGVPGKNRILNRGNLFVHDLPGVQDTSINAVSSTRKVKLYDKTFETKESNNSKKNKQITFMENLCRLEYIISKREEIAVYFRGKTNLFDMTQDDLNYAFRKLTRVLLKEPLEEYYRDFDNAVEEYFKRINIHNRKWRLELIRDLLLAVHNSRVGYYNMTEEELRHYVTVMNAASVTAHGARIASGIKNEIQKLDGRAIKVTKGKKEYIPLINWLCNIDGEEEQYIYYLYK